MKRVLNTIIIIIIGIIAFVFIRFILQKETTVDNTIYDISGATTISDTAHINNYPAAIDSGKLMATPYFENDSSGINEVINSPAIVSEYFYLDNASDDLYPLSGGAYGYTEGTDYAGSYMANDNYFPYYYDSYNYGYNYNYNYDYIYDYNYDYEYNYNYIFPLIPYPVSPLYPPQKPKPPQKPQSPYKPGRPVENVGERTSDRNTPGTLPEGGGRETRPDNQGRDTVNRTSERGASPPREVNNKGEGRRDREEQAERERRAADSRRQQEEREREEQARVEQERRDAADRRAREEQAAREQRDREEQAERERRAADNRRQQEEREREEQARAEQERREAADRRAREEQAAREQREREEQAARESREREAQAQRGTATRQVR